MGPGRARTRVAGSVIVTGVAAILVSLVALLGGQRGAYGAPPAPADLEITKSAPATVEPGGTITYTITLTNNGPGDAVGVTVHDPTDDAVVEVVASSSGCSTGHTVTCPVNALPAGESRTFTFTARISPDVAEGDTITNCAMVYTGSNDPDDENNVSCTDTDVQPATPTPTPPDTLNVRTEKSGPLVTTPGSTITYTLTITNEGDTDLGRVFVSDPIDPSLTVTDVPDGCSMAGRVLVCAAGLAAGESVTIPVEVTVDPDATTGTVIPDCVAAETLRRERSVDDNGSCVQTVVIGPTTPSPSPTVPTGTPTTSPTVTPTPPPTTGTPTDVPTSPEPSPTETAGPAPAPTSGTPPAPAPTGPRGGLPMTGTAATGIGLAGLLLVAAGLALRVGATRRRS